MTKITVSDDPKTWLERLESDETSKQLNKIHQNFIDLFKTPDVTVLDEHACEKTMDSITNMNMTANITQSQIDGEMMLLHQLSKIWEGIRNKVT